MVVKRPFIICYLPSPEMEIFAFCVITFEPINIQTQLAPQNDRLNLSFVKHENIVFNGRKTAIRVGGLERLLLDGDPLISSIVVSLNEIQKIILHEFMTHTVLSSSLINCIQLSVHPRMCWSIKNQGTYFIDSISYFFDVKRSANRSVIALLFFTGQEKMNEKLVKSIFDFKK